MTEKRVVVQIELGVQGHEPAVGCQQPGIDLDQPCVQPFESAKHREQEVRGRCQQGPAQAQRQCDAARLKSVQTCQGVDALAYDRLRLAGRQILDVHAAARGGHQDGASQRSIDRHGHVHLATALEIKPFFDQQTPHHSAFGPCLLRNETRPQQVARVGLDLGERAREPHASAFAAAPGVDLRLDDDRETDLIRDLAGLFYGPDSASARHGHAVARQQALGLMLMQLHALASYDGPVGARRRPLGREREPSGRAARGQCASLAPPAARCVTDAVVLRTPADSAGAPPR